jgi:hypothetical protein
MKTTGLEDVGRVATEEDAQSHVATGQNLIVGFAFSTIGYCMKKLMPGNVSQSAD